MDFILRWLKLIWQYCFFTRNWVDLFNIAPHWINRHEILNVLFHSIHCQAVDDNDLVKEKTVTLNSNFDENSERLYIIGALNSIKNGFPINPVTDDL